MSASTAFKLYITITYKGLDAPAPHKTIRRFSAKAGTTLAEFRAILIEEILRRPDGSVAVAVSYKDADGDVVEVMSELEWAEALQQHSGSLAAGTAIPILIDATFEGSEPLNNSMLFSAQSLTSIPLSREISVGTVPATTTEASSETVQVPFSSAQMQTDASAVSSPATSEAHLPPFPEPTAQSPTIPIREDVSREPTEGEVASNDAEVAAPPSPAHITITTVEADGNPDSHTTVWPNFAPSDAPLLTLLSNLFSCDANKELLDPFRRTNFGSLLRRTIDPWTDSLRIDIYRSQVRNFITTKATSLMASADAASYEQALVILKSGVELFPTDATLQYHLACAMSLTKASAAAVVDQLRAALAKGYGSIEGLSQDPFFANLRATEPAMMQLVGSSDPYVAELLAVYPSISIEEAKDALARHGQNVHHAAAYLADRIFAVQRSNNNE